MSRADALAGVEQARDYLDSLEDVPQAAFDYAESLGELAKYMDSYVAKGEDPFAEALERLQVLKKVQDAVGPADFDDLPRLMKYAADAGEEAHGFVEELRPQLGPEPVVQLATALWRLRLIPASAGAAEVAEALAGLCNDATARISVQG